MKVLDSKQVAAFLSATSNLKRDGPMSDRCLCAVYRTDTDGALLVLFDGTGRYYEQYDELLNRVNRARDQSSNMIDLLPDGPTFAERIDGRIAELPKLLDIDGSRLDVSLPSLRLIDVALRRVESSRILSPPVFPAILAYVGEVIRRS